jgi:hypothetical protein
VQLHRAVRAGEEAITHGVEKGMGMELLMHKNKIDNIRVPRKAIP